MESQITDDKYRYEILIKARNFHYENFNKWMSYFYVMIGSIILGFAYVISKDQNYAQNYKNELITLGFAGFIISLLWHWANKGYYYWNINFITLVNHYEINVFKLEPKDRMYSVFANKRIQNDYASPISGANISTSKISILLSYLFACAFATYSIKQLLEDYLICNDYLTGTSIIISIVLIYMLSNILAKRFLFSYIDHFEDLKIEFDKAKQ